MSNKKIVVYPAFFEEEPTMPGTFNVTFPDVPEAITFGNNLPQAFERAAEALGLILYDEKELPTPSDLEQLKKDMPQDTFVNYVYVDLDEIKRNVKQPVVRKNTTIPVDLAEKAEKANINFSAILTEALKEKLGV